MRTAPDLQEIERRNESRQLCLAASQQIVTAAE